MQSLNAPVAMAVAKDARDRAARRRAAVPEPQARPPGRAARPVAVLAARVARRLDADAARRVLNA